MASWSAIGLDSAKPRAYSKTTPAWSRAAAAQMTSGSSSRGHQLVERRARQRAETCRSRAAMPRMAALEDPLAVLVVARRAPRRSAAARARGAKARPAAGPFVWVRLCGKKSAGACLPLPQPADSLPRSRSTDLLLEIERPETSLPARSMPPARQPAPRQAPGRPSARPASNPPCRLATNDRARMRSSRLLLGLPTFPPCSGPSWAKRAAGWARVAGGRTQKRAGLRAPGPAARQTRGNTRLEIQATAFGPVCHTEAGALCQNFAFTHQALRRRGLHAVSEAG